MRKYGSSGAAFSDATPPPRKGGTRVGAGRPPIVIDMERVTGLLARGVGVRRAAAMIGVSFCTLYRRLKP